MPFGDVKKDDNGTNKRKSDKLDNGRVIKTVKSDKLSGSKSSSENGQSNRRSTKRITITKEDRLFLADVPWSLIKGRSSGSIKTKYRKLMERLNSQ